jgi:serine/threonine-protein kinase
MDIVCTRPSCPRPENHFADLDNRGTLTTVQQKFCTACGMPLILSGRYLPEKLLGKGGFGAAFLACDRYTPTLRPCVVKLFQPSGDLNPEQLQLAQTLFQREAAVLEELGNKHPQIPDLYAFFPLIVSGQKPGIQEEYFYLVQEFIDGEDLEQTLARKGPLPSASKLKSQSPPQKIRDPGVRGSAPDLLHQ